MRKPCLYSNNLFGVQYNVLLGRKKGGKRAAPGRILFFPGVQLQGVSPTPVHNLYGYNNCC